MTDKKMTNKERDIILKNLVGKTNNTDLVLSLFIEFMGKNVDFKKFLIDWQEKQKKEKEKSESKIIMPPEKKIITP